MGLTDLIIAAIGWRRVPAARLFPHVVFEIYPSGSANSGS